MIYRLFQYALPAPPELEDLNAFLRSERVAAVSQYLAQTAGGAMLVFVVETVPSGARVPGPAGLKVDYREQLSAADFSTFSRLREERRRWAEAEGVPVYTVFTNAQLAEMVKRPVRTTADLAAIEGIGEARVAKYGTRILTLFANLPQPPTGASGEGKP
jgi:superfamily II DNA helicase RecQ